MKVFNTKTGIIVEHQNEYYLADSSDWDAFVNRPGLYKKLLANLPQLKMGQFPSGLPEDILLAPIRNQEVWASGVTYMRSREARMEESKDAGGGDFYARVYEAARPELFFKATAGRTVGPGAKVRIRKDSLWNVPEPELTLFICSAGSIEGYTAGNDMSSRDIEGENPLYLPQAKSYDASAAIGPCLYVPEHPIDPETQIKIQISRSGAIVFDAAISISRMKRKHQELVDYLFRETSFTQGVYLMTGTGIVPPDSFTLQVNDVISIQIDGIGTLVNTVAQ
jgi:2-dehydro-3-deoxy-D-arabinonate dehydratase